MKLDDKMRNASQPPAKLVNPTGRHDSSKSDPWFYSAFGNEQLAAKKRALRDNTCHAVM